MTLHVPELPDGCDVLKAALLYAGAGWYVLPVSADTKHPGSLLGNGWQTKTSRDPGVIAGWFAGTSAMLALHVGRSGAVAFDVDSPGLMPQLLRAAVNEYAPPYQSTRTTSAQRGHYVFAAEAGTIGNSAGDLGKGWGEVRGLNGIIVVEPTRHEKAAEGGRYRWMRTGALPALPAELAASLRPPGASAGTVDTAAVREFLDGLADGEPCRAVAAVREPMPAGGRHDFMTGHTLRLARLGEQGHQGVRATLLALREEFVTRVAPDRRGGRPQAEHEFHSALAGAVAEVTAAPTPQVDKGCCTPDLPDVDFSAEGAAAVASQGDGTDLLGGEGGAGGAGGLVAALRARLLTAAQMRDVRPPAVLVDGLLTLDSESWLIAKPGSYKTFVALDLAGHVATGKPWMGREVARGEVVYLVAEGIGGMGQRVRAWEQRNGEMTGVHFLPLPVQAKEKEHWAALVELCREISPVLITLDTQARITVGLNENDNSEMGEFVHAIGRLRRATGACVLTVHHLGRNGQDARGASAIDGAQDSELRLTRVANAERRVVLETDKQRHLPDNARVELELFTCELDGGGSSLVVGAPLGGPGGTAPDWRANLSINQAVLVEAMADIFPGQGATKAELKAEARKRARTGPLGEVLEPMGESSFRRAWDALVDSGRFAKVHGVQRYVLESLLTEVSE